MKPPEAIDAKNLGSPDTAWTFLDESERAAVQLGRVAIGRGVYRPGWRWSQHVQPLSGRDSVEHIGYVISGRMRIRAQAGTEVEVGPGDAFIAPPGHDAWVVGDEPCVALDFIPGWCAQGTSRNARTSKDSGRRWPCLTPPDARPGRKTSRR